MLLNEKLRLQGFELQVEPLAEPGFLALSSPWPPLILCTEPAKARNFWSLCDKI